MANPASANRRSRLILALLIRFRCYVILRAEISPVIPARAGIRQPGVPWVLNPLKPGPDSREKYIGQARIPRISLPGNWE